MGAVLATMAVVMPSFFIIILITALLKNAIKNPYVQAILRGMKPCVIGIVLATGIYMMVTNCVGIGLGAGVQVQAVIVAVLLVIASGGYRYFCKKRMSPITLIIVSAFIGVIVYGI